MRVTTVFEFILKSLYRFFQSDDCGSNVVIILSNDYDLLLKYMKQNAKNMSTLLIVILIVDIQVGDYDI